MIADAPEGSPATLSVTLLASPERVRLAVTRPIDPPAGRVSAPEERATESDPALEEPPALPPPEPVDETAPLPHPTTEKPEMPMDRQAAR